MESWQWEESNYSREAGRLFVVWHLHATVLLQIFAFVWLFVWLYCIFLVLGVSCFFVLFSISTCRYTSSFISKPV